MKKVDLIGIVIFAIILIVLFFFWQCKWDLWATVFAAVVMLASAVAIYLQTRKLNKLQAKKEKEA